MTHSCCAGCRELRERPVSRTTKVLAAVVAAALVGSAAGIARPVLPSRKVR